MLHSESGENSIATGITAGFALGFLPAFSLQGVLILLCSLFFRVQLGALLLSWIVFSFLSLSLSSFLDGLGFKVLMISNLEGFYTAMASNSFLALTHFNNTIVAGSIIIVSFMIAPLFFVSKFAISKYRNSIGNRITNHPWMKLFRKTKLYSIFQAYLKVKERI